MWKPLTLFFPSQARNAFSLECLAKFHPVTLPHQKGPFFLKFDNRQESLFLKVVLTLGNSEIVRPERPPSRKCRKVVTTVSAALSLHLRHMKPTAGIRILEMYRGQDEFENGYQPELIQHRITRAICCRFPQYFEQGEELFLSFAEWTRV
jgi:hypothetical protein